MRVIYIAGPISQGNLLNNIRQACDAGLELLRAGHAPVIPHLSCFAGCRALGGMFVPEVVPAGTTLREWYAADLQIVRRCDAVLRLPGASVGADAEVQLASELSLPVFTSVASVVAYYQVPEVNDLLG